MAQTLVAHEQAIQKIFSDEYVFTIPSYQRPYSWKVEQARELFDDLTGFIDANPGPVASMPAYFLGSIVLIKSDTPQAQIVDGQQRLTTLTVLLSAIREQVEPQLRSNLTRRLYEQGDTFAGTQDRYRLTLRDKDTTFFQRYIQREGGLKDLAELAVGLSDSQRNLKANAILFRTLLASLTEAQRVELAQFILQRCYLVVVSTPDENSAFRIFSVLNSRGLDLTATDILKSRVVGAIEASQRDAYTKKWEDAEEELGRDDFNTLFAHIRTIYRKAKAKETLLKEFESYVEDLKRPTTFIDNILLPMCQAFGEITTSTYSAPSRASEVNEYLRWLNRLEFNDWVPPAIAFMIRHRQRPETLAEFFSSLERLAYYMLTTGAGINVRIERFARVTSEVESLADLYSESSALQLTPPEQYEFYQALNGPIYESLSAKARTPILLRLDSLLADGSATYNYPVISVEHVLPQNPAPESKWLKLFPDAVARSRTVHTLGNLALLTRRKNSAASNWDFERKKDSYFLKDGICPFALTTQVLNEKDWTSEVIERRQTVLLNTLAKHWRLEGRMSVSETLLKMLT